MAPGQNQEKRNGWICRSWSTSLEAHRPEAAELSKKLEVWGVGGGAPRLPRRAAAVAAAAAAAPRQTEFTLVLVDAGGKKINVIKEVRAPAPA